MSVDFRRFVTTAGWCAAGAFIALAAPATALAEPAPPAPVVPAPAPVLPVPAPAVPAPGPAVVAAPAPAPAPGAPAPAPGAAVVAAAPPSLDGTPHLPSPDALPVGTTMDPALANRDATPNTSYLRDLWHAVQSQEISGKEALILGLSQRGMNTPLPAQAPGPNVPIQYPRDQALPPAPLPPGAPVPPPPGAPVPAPVPAPAPLP